MLKYFTDASYSPTQNVAVVGFRRSDHKLLHFKVLSNVKNTEAELIGVRECIEDFERSGHEKCQIFTDCQKAVKAFEHPNCEIIKVQGHKRSKDKTPLDFEFSRVDKAVRKHLRYICREAKKGPIE